ncbi:MAG TPA: protein kinase [Planktothrix sp.]
MSSNELQIPYETPLIKIAKAARGFDTTARALWMAYVLILVVFFFAGLSNLFAGPNPLLSPLSESMGLSEWKWLALLTGVILFVTFTLELIDKVLFPVLAAAHLEFSEDFLSLPVSSLLTASLRLRRAWSDIESVSIEGGDKVCVRFKSKGSALIALPVIPLQQRHLVLLAFGVKCGAGAIEGAAPARGRDPIELWQESVNRRFHGTSYNVLKADAQLQQGRFVVRRLLSSREFSATYLGQQSDSALFIIKELVLPQATYAASRRARSNMMREIQTPLADASQRIMPAVEFFREQSRDYLVYEYCSGESLREIVSQSGPVSELKALGWCAQIAEILTALHENQPPIVHCNLSPDDLIVKEEQLFLTDCGTVNRYLNTITSGFAGKRAYVAAECLRGQRSPANDLYSLGRILYFLVAGSDPLPLATVQCKLKGRAGALYEQLTREDPSERITSAREASSRIREAITLVEPNTVQHG